MFIFNEKSSKDMFLTVLNDIEFSSPNRDVQIVHVPGRDGDLIVDNGRFESVIRRLPCRLEVPEGEKIENLVTQINNWLMTVSGFKPFIWETDDDFLYLARVEGGVSTKRLLEKLGHTVITFRFHPVKYLKSSLQPIVITSGSNIENPFMIDAKPLMKIEGNTREELIISIGGRSLTLRGVGSGCIIDSETQTITDSTGNVTLFDRLYASFPVLTPGENKIIFPEDIQLEITPRLGALV